MRSFILAVSLAAFSVPLYGQAPWCFSQNCPESSVATFTLNRQDKQLDQIFKTLTTLPTYHPIAPLTFAPSSGLFFLHTAPVGSVNAPPGLSGLGGLQGANNASQDDMIGVHIPSAQHSSPATGRYFPTGEGGLGFRPKF
jgi:hypothetical protein